MDGLPPEGFDGRSTEGLDGRSTDGFDGLWFTDGFLSDGRISGFGLFSGRFTDEDGVPDGRPETEGLTASFLVFEDDLEYEDEDVDLDD